VIIGHAYHMNAYTRREFATALAQFLDEKRGPAKK
jgi:hypothetical protein